MVEASQLMMMYAPATSPPMRTMIHPRWRAGMVSDTSEKMIGSIPPTPKPMMKHMTRLILYSGMAPQVEVAMNMTAAMRIDARRPIRSASHPQMNEPMTVPLMPDRGYRAMGSPAAWGCSGDRRP